MKHPQRLRELCDDVWVASARAYQTTSTVLLDGNGGALVIDPAWFPDELKDLTEDLTVLGARCVGGVATHEHYDHVLWEPGLGDVPRWTSPQTAEHYRTSRAELVEPARAFLTDDLLDLAGRLRPLAGSSVPWSGGPVRAFTHDAHAPGHLALLMEDTGVLIVGDMLSDVELPMPAEDDTTLDTYLAGLVSLRPLVERATWLIPGHGTPTDDPQARYEADLAYLQHLLAGRDCPDPRRANPGMGELHAANVSRAE